MKRCDLHIHSKCSDGSLTPSEIVSLAAEAGIDAIALTDHNTAAGIAQFLDCAEKAGIEACGGVEFTTDWRGRELHILALFVSPCHAQRIAEYTAPAQESKKKVNAAMIEALQSAGYDISTEEVKRTFPAGNINRSHIARILVSKGYVGSVEEAFCGILADDGGFYIPPYRLPAIDTVRFIKSLGAVAVIAHPYLDLDPESLCEFLSEAKEAGLDGMETRYSKYTPETETMAHECAVRFGLCESGGSDYHGVSKPRISLGVGQGELFVPYEFYLRLSEAARRSADGKKE